MTFFQAIFLGIIQGLTEFLPISSSGHLVIFQKILGLKPPVLFDILVHVGTLGAILVFFNNRLKKFFTLQYLWYLGIGTVPAVISGLFFLGYLEIIFASTRLVAVSLLITAGLLFSTKIKTSRKKLKTLNALRSFWVGVFQGISRSGATISAGLLSGLSRKEAFEFSFILAIPATLGALLTQIPGLNVSLNRGILAGGAGMVTAGLVGWFCLKLLEKMLRSKKFWLFGFYCLIVGVALLI